MFLLKNTSESVSEDSNREEYEVVAKINYYNLETKEFASKNEYIIHMIAR